MEKQNDAGETNPKTKPKQSSESASKGELMGINRSSRCQTAARSCSNSPFGPKRRNLQLNFSSGRCAAPRGSMRARTKTGALSPASARKHARRHARTCGALKHVGVARTSHCGCFRLVSWAKKARLHRGPTGGGTGERTNRAGVHRLRHEELVGKVATRL